MAVVGISGGKDSSVVAALCVEALGKDRVFGVLMPQGEQPDIDYSRMLVDHLGIDSCVVNIGNTVRTLKHEIKPQLGDRWSKQTSTNLPARIRMTTLVELQIRVIFQKIGWVTPQDMVTLPVISVRYLSLQ